ncbi:MAG: Fe-S cluster assembly sulfur transfer protein SufU [Spirochaetota bacterium]
MPNIEQLYQDTILSHNRSPRNFRKPEQYNFTSIGRNPLCGDSYQLFAQIEGEQLTDISFWGEGCAVSKASASIMGELLKGKSLSEAEKLKDDFLQLLLLPEKEALLTSLPRKLQVFQGIREYPMRVKCATLIWRALEAILQNQGSGDGPAVVGTE